MNYLLHRHFARREAPPGADVERVAIGAMLPDLFRLVAPRRALLRGAAIDALRAHDDVGVRALGEGVAHHHAIDRWFHGCVVFTQGERALKERFFALGTKRLLLFAHPGFEMCLDGAWLARGEAVPPVTPADRALVVEAARVADLPVDLPRLIRVLDAYGTGLLHDDYRAPAGIARRIAGMRRAFGFGDVGEADLDRWAAALVPSVAMAPEALAALERERASFLGAGGP